ncbi:hypothetical protein [Streptomyces fradiae]|uniref:hypothetical protein n=1 Tax=Streptomyces fradiae TaxID=1906 RepID=UPI00294350B3|nr:hypothetical protein [Streptomyces fradiae]WOI61931.1 hypothetical protein RYQ63_19625 [Streptomyces fradiae]
MNIEQSWKQVPPEVVNICCSFSSTKPPSPTVAFPAGAFPAGAFPAGAVAFAG